MRERVDAAGGDPDDIPEISPPRFLRAPEVRELTGLCTSTLYRMMSAGEFPRPIPIDRASSRAA
jgi:predicted DNA-binding transcriptional regulator AlpA